MSFVKKGRSLEFWSQWSCAPAWVSANGRLGRALPSDCSMWVLLALQCFAPRPSWSTDSSRSSLVFFSTCQVFRALWSDCDTVPVQAGDHPDTSPLPTGWKTAVIRKTWVTWSYCQWLACVVPCNGVYDGLQFDGEWPQQHFVPRLPSPGAQAIPVAAQ